MVAATVLNKAIFARKLNNFKASNLLKNKSRTQVLILNSGHYFVNTYIGLIKKQVC